MDIVIAIGCFTIALFLLCILCYARELRQIGIRGILSEEGCTYKELWTRVYGDKEMYGDKEFSCLEDLTDKQILEFLETYYKKRGY